MIMKFFFTINSLLNLINLCNSFNIFLYSMTTHVRSTYTDLFFFTISAFDIVVQVVWHQLTFELCWGLPHDLDAFRGQRGRLEVSGLAGDIVWNYSKSWTKFEIGVTKTNNREHRFTGSNMHPLIVYQ